MATARPERALRISPLQELVFSGPFTNFVTTGIVVTNDSATRVAFKMLTTSPERYCVTPNAGWIEPKDSIRISVTLAPFELDSSTSRELVKLLWMFAPDPEDIDQDRLWNTAPPDVVRAEELRVSFVLPKWHLHVPVATEEGPPSPPSHDTLREATSKCETWIAHEANTFGEADGAMAVMSPEQEKPNRKRKLDGSFVASAEAC